MAVTTLTIAQDTAFGLLQAANGLGVSVEELAERAILRYLRESAEQKIDVEEAHYKTQHQQLLQSYANQVIAMHEGRVVDSDNDDVALYLRIRQQYPMVGVLLKRVTPQANSPFEPQTAQKRLQKSPRLLKSGSCKPES